MNRFFGGLLLAAGILIMTCSGLCSAFVIVMGYQAAIRDPSAILIPIFIGGTPFMIGFGLFRWGQDLLRREDDDRF